MVAVGKDVVVLDADRAETHSMEEPVSLIAVAPKGEYVACCSPSGRQTVCTLDLTQVCRICRLSLRPRSMQKLYSYVPLPHLVRACVLAC